jgi:hypothetical protein
MQLNMDQVEKLFGIFSPRASQRQKNMVANSGQLVHYTSAENALNILKSEEIWLRNARAMQDFSEVEYGYHFLHEYFSSVDNKKNFIDALSLIDDNLGQDGIRHFDAWWASIRNATYIACFSEHDSVESEHGRLSMWRAFAQNVNGVALVFKFPQPDSATPLNVFFTPVEYRTSVDFSSEFNAVFENIKLNQDFLRSIDRQLIVGTIYVMLMTMAISSKHPGFLEEREWRLVHSPMQSPSIFIPSVVEVINGIPQLVHKVSLKDNVEHRINNIEISDLLVQVIIGPTKYPESVRDAFIYQLEKLGVPNSVAKVKISGIPIRT